MKDPKQIYEKKAPKIEKHEVLPSFTSSLPVINLTKDNITNSVIEDLLFRANKGYHKYATTLEENDHQNMLQHAYEESLDLSQYLKKEITTLNTVQDLVRQYPNDADLGRVIREKYVQA
jgi:hypothetical protein